LELGPNAVKVLRALEVEGALKQFACEPANIVSLAWDDAHLRFREPLRAIAATKFGAPYLTVHRADLHRLLCERLPADAIHVDAKCTHVASAKEGAAATFADGSAVEADLIVGAAGVNSAGGEKLCGLQQARYTQQMAWRCIVPIACVPTAVGPGRTVTVGRDEYVGWIGPEGHVICYPIRSGELYNIFAGHVSEEWVDESWVVPSTVDELLAGYRGWNEALLAMLRNVEQCLKWAIGDRAPLPHWMRGRITLLGDAAHPMMPTLAQGAAMALEDAYALARNLARCRPDVEQGLAAYQSERLPRARAVQLQARQQFHNNRRNPAPPPLS